MSVRIGEPREPRRMHKQGCAYCRGTGQIQDNKSNTYTCGFCNGTGKAN